MGQPTYEELKEQAADEAVKRTKDVLMAMARRHAGTDSAIAYAIKDCIRKVEYYMKRTDTGRR